MNTRDFTAGAKLVPRDDGRYEIDIRGRIVPSPGNRGWTLFQAETVLDRIEDECRGKYAELTKRMARCN